MKRFLMMALVSSMITITACGTNSNSQTKVSNTPATNISTTVPNETLSPSATNDIVLNTTNTPAVSNPTPGALSSSEPTLDGVTPAVTLSPTISTNIPENTFNPTSTPKPEPTHELTTLKPTDEAAPTATSKPTSKPTSTVKPTSRPTVVPTVKPTATVKPTVAPTVKPTSKPTAKPTVAPTEAPLPKVTIYSSFSDYGYGHFEEVREEYTELFYDRVIYYINKYRAEEGQAPAVKHTKISQVAEFRAWQSENFICGSSDPNHTCEPTVCGYQGHSEPASHISWMVAAEEFEYGYKNESGNWLGVGEAYASSCGFYADTIDFAAFRVTTGFHDSEGHWRYLGDEYYRYIGVGVAENGHDLFICVSELDENLNDYHKIHSPDGLCHTHNCNCP